MWTILNSLHNTFRFPHSGDEIYFEVMDYYSQPWRKFHNEKHVEGIIKKIKQKALPKEDETILTLVAIYHDVIYYPWSKTNEEDSAVLFDTHWEKYGNLETLDMDKVVDIILQTKDHSGTDRLSLLFNEMDMSILKGKPNKLLQWEKDIWGEYSFTNTKSYKDGRLAFLKKNMEIHPNLKFLIPLVMNFRPRVGFYAGSFNPFHVGHLSIVEQAKSLFDKVVVVLAQNPGKEVNSERELNERKAGIFNYLGGVEVIILPHGNFLPDLLRERSEEEEVFLIRGVRNSMDWATENNQIQYMENIWKDLKTVYLTCPVELQHISSSGIRQIEKIKKGSAEEYIPKPVIE